MAKESVKSDKDRCKDCAFEIFDVMDKHRLSECKIVRVLAGVLYSYLAVWNERFPQVVVDDILRLFVESMYPMTEDKEHKKLETLLKKHFV